MKLLLIVDRVDYPFAVNPKLAYRLAGALAAAGHGVQLLELWDGQFPLPQPPAGVTRTALPFADERRMNEALEHGNAEGSPAARRLWRLAQRPDAALAAARQLLLHRPRRQTACCRALETLDAAGFDAMVAVCAPFHAAFALGEARVKAKKALWLMDPYSILRDPRAAENEARLYGSVDRLFITRQMEKDFAAGPWAGKARVLDFPALVPPPPAAPREGPPTIAFVGNLYPRLRTPHFALALFAGLNAPEWRFVFAGSGWEHYPADFLQPYREALGERLQLPGSLPGEQAAALLAQADVLLNLGNAGADQLPSKIFEYFAAGKPVLNLCKEAGDPSLAYFARYPLALTLMESDGAGPQVCEKTARWLRQTAGQRLPFAEVSALFADNLPETVAARMAAALENL